MKWYATIKPYLVETEAIVNEIIRYEEIQVFYLDLENTDYLYGIAHQIFKKVKYPCLLVMCYQNKFLCSCCRIAAGKIDYDNNILGRICFSHWIHPDLLTDKYQNMLSEINQALNLKSNLYDIYIKMAH